MKFVADGMLGRFSRWLRMLGCDTKYYRDASDDTLLDIAKEEDRTLLTRDAELFKRANLRMLRTLFVEGKSEAEQLANFARQFNFKLEIDMSISLCPVCGSPLHSIERDAVLDKVPSGTLKNYNAFWICDTCGKVYWQGAHWKKINETLTKTKMLIEKNVT
ncbi:MAG: Mut7-C RNAse domain-containing protein [Candidatus Bathyarchaeota archaeon]